MRSLLLRSLLLTTLTFGAGVVLYSLMGINVGSATLFAVACGVASVLAARIR